MARVAVACPARSGFGAIDEHYGAILARKRVRHGAANHACTNHGYRTLLMHSFTVYDLSSRQQP
jgi:hypothetical protein